MTYHVSVNYKLLRKRGVVFVPCKLFCKVYEQLHVSSIICTFVKGTVADADVLANAESAIRSERFVVRRFEWIFLRESHRAI
jgi:hypothetical protein